MNYKRKGGKYPERYGPGAGKYIHSHRIGIRAQSVEMKLALSFSERVSSHEIGLYPLADMNALSNKHLCKLKDSSCAMKAGE